MALQILSSALKLKPHVNPCISGIRILSGLSNTQLLSVEAELECIQGLPLTEHDENYERSVRNALVELQRWEEVLWK